MAGLSSRFFKVGYTVPKYQLQICGQTVFAHSVLSFKQYFQSEKFVFVIRDVFDTEAFVVAEANKLGIADFEIKILDAETRGQAETASLALKDYEGDFSVTIFNIDTFRFDYVKPAFVDDCDGYLEVFKAEGEHWSFVLPGDNYSVLKTTEKERISDLCSDGLYYFKSKLVFEKLFGEAVLNEQTVRGEYYVAPLYNQLISAGGVVMYDTIESNQIALCGTPEEYELLKEEMLAVEHGTGDKS
jgi:dTDP-glucose pyrophosphorylase